MNDPDAKIWTVKGKSMTLLPRKDLSMSNAQFLQWAEDHLEGEYLTTPTYIGFEHAKDAEVFEVMYRLTK